MDSKITIGGQAVIEGVMMRSKDKYAIAVRRPDKKISVKTMPIKKRGGIWNIPFFRGIVRFGETMLIGIKSLEYSASESLGEEESITAMELAFTLLTSFALTIVLFYVVPLFLARFFTVTRGLWFNIIDGILRLVIFLSYLLAISLFPDVRRIFQYHGAEHMTVHCYEAKEDLTVKNVRKYTTLHPRCGTNFILIVFVISILMFTVINVDTYLHRLGIRLLLLPIIAGVSYEILRFGGKHYENPIVRTIIWPGLMLQKITTKQPEDDMIEVAIKSMKAVL